MLLTMQKEQNNLALFGFTHCQYVEFRQIIEAKTFFTSRSGAVVIFLNGFAICWLCSCTSA